MKDALKRERVKGFLHVRDGRIVNEDGEEVLLTGWGLGNYLLCEGYMWLNDGANRMDRPRRIEDIVRECAGSEYAEAFWKKYRENYITEADIRRMAELGYNSVRIPITSRLFIKEEPGLQWVEEGFLLLDRVIDFCEKYGVYAFIDLHGAPGGQTGANIDDSIDDLPRLFIDRDSYDKGVALWKKLAERYKDRSIVAGYDLLNEPLRSPRKTLPDGTPDPEDDMAKYLPELSGFYRDAIAAIREVDPNHLLSLEGHRWATDPAVFDHSFDPEMVIHFHRYACHPGPEVYTEYLERQDALKAPLWLGETGENYPEWYAAMYPLALELSIGFNIWPWKKLSDRHVQNNPYRIRTPKNWKKITDYANGGVRPSYEEAQEIFDEFLENMKLENCEFSEKVHASLFRRPGTTLRATDFDELPLADGSLPYAFNKAYENDTPYRKNTGAHLVNHYPDAARMFAFDTMMMRYTLGLEKGESIRYSFYDIASGNTLDITGFTKGCVRLSVTLLADGTTKKTSEYAFGVQKSTASEAFAIRDLPLPDTEKLTVLIEVIDGSPELEELILK